MPKKPRFSTLAPWMAPGCSNAAFPPGLPAYRTSTSYRPMDRGRRFWRLPHTSLSSPRAPPIVPSRLTSLPQSPTSGRPQRGWLPWPFHCLSVGTLSQRDKRGFHPADDDWPRRLALSQARGKRQTCAGSRADAGSVCRKGWPPSLAKRGAGLVQSSPGGPGTTAKEWRSAEEWLWRARGARRVRSGRRGLRWAPTREERGAS